MQHIVIIGRNGQLARELADLDWPRAFMPCFLGSNEINLFDGTALATALFNNRPAAIINTAAYTAVDRAESEPGRAVALNAEAPLALATFAAAAGIPLVHVSTDYVFAGDATTPYRESQTPVPVAVYGQSKRAGEIAVLTSGANAVVVRSASLFGRHGQNFVKTMVARSSNQQPVTMVADQIQSPTPAASLAAELQRMAIDLIAGRQLPALLHLAGAPAVSWFDFTSAIFAALKVSGRVHLPALQRIRLRDLSRPAPRPLYSALDCDLAASLGYRIADWRSTLSPLIEHLLAQRIAA